MANFPGKGTVLQVAINTTYVDVSQIVSLEGPGGVMGTREITHLLSSAREFAPTIHDGGEVTATILYDPNSPGQAYVQGQVYTATPGTTGSAFRLAFATTTKNIAFGAVPTAFPFTGFTVDDTVTVNLGLKVTGLLTVPTTT